MNIESPHRRWLKLTCSVGLTVLSAFVPTSASAQQKSATSDRPVTFTKDVAPILQRSCVTCHRPGEMAPMSLQTYEDARP